VLHCDFEFATNHTSVFGAERQTTLIDSSSQSTVV